MSVPRSVPLLLAALAACAGPPAESPVPVAQEVPWREPPEFVRESPEEWVRLNSGEWLRGEVAALLRGTLEFDSQELDTLNLDWDDVAELYTTRPFTLLLEDQSTVTGSLDVQGDVVRVATAEGERRLARADVQRVVAGTPGERQHWSGSVKVGFTTRRGNTEQTDSILNVLAKRRTPATRLDLTLDAVHSDQSGSEIANNQRFTGKLDYFVTSRLFLTPLGLEAFRDRFQNIGLRLTPYTGVGYTLIEGHGVEWDGTLGLGYRYTRYDSVMLGEDDVDDTFVVIAGTGATAHLTEKMELIASYTAQIGIEDVQETQHNASLRVSYDAFGGLDLDVGVAWVHVGQPQPDASGMTPEPDDFRLDVGLSWSF